MTYFYDLRSLGLITLKVSPLEVIKADLKLDKLDESKIEKSIPSKEERASLIAVDLAFSVYTRITGKSDKVDFQFSWLNSDEGHKQYAHCYKLALEKIENSIKLENLKI